MDRLRYAGQVVKVSMPAAGAPARFGLIYPRNRVAMRSQALDQATLDALGEDREGFFEARYVNFARGWVIGRRVADQPW